MLPVYIYAEMNYISNKSTGNITQNVAIMLILQKPMLCSRLFPALSFPFDNHGNQRITSHFNANYFSDNHHNKMENGYLRMNGSAENILLVEKYCTVPHFIVLHPFPFIDSMHLTGW